VTDSEFSAVAYAFLDSLPRIGSGNPKGIAIAEFEKMPLLVVDRYLVPKGKRPIISPSETNPAVAISEFIRLCELDKATNYCIQDKHFERWIGDAALEKLQDCACDFVDKVLEK
jgi:hypothetical protein